MRKCGHDLPGTILVVDKMVPVVAQGEAGVDNARSETQLPYLTPDLCWEPLELVERRCGWRYRCSLSLALAQAEQSSSDGEGHFLKILGLSPCPLTSRPAELIFLGQRDCPPPHALPASRSETKGSPSPTNRILPYRTYMDRYMDGTTKQQALFPTAYHTYSICGPWNKVFKVQLGFLRGAQCATAPGSIPTGFGPPHWH